MNKKTNPFSLDEITTKLKLDLLFLKFRLMHVEAQGIMIRDFLKALTKKKVITRNKLVIETDIDKIFNFLREKGKVSIEETAKRFNINQESLNEWIKILEKHGVAVAEFPLLKPPMLKFVKEWGPHSRIRNVELETVKV